MSYQLEVYASDTVKTALSGIGRTEDIKLSPDNRRLAIAGFRKNEILIIDLTIGESAENKSVNLSNCTSLTSDSLRLPHGVCFFDNDTLGVANRDGGVVLFRIPETTQEGATYKLSPIQHLGADRTDRIKTPGSVIATKIGLDLYEMLVCNNYTNKVTRHILDAQSNHSVLKSEILLSQGLNVPDGIAISKDSQRIAISNHDTHNVLLFKNDFSLGPNSEPCGTLEGIKYPHGVSFTCDDNFILLADAGTPYIHIYAKKSNHWHGEHYPAASIAVMDEKTFIRGSYNPQEGGPKGIDIASNMKTFVTTCHLQTLAFFDLERILGDYNLLTSSKSLASNIPVSIDIERQLARQALLRELKDPESVVRQQIAELDAEHARQIEYIFNTRSWRITAPLRVVILTLRSLKLKWINFKLERRLN